MSRLTHFACRPHRRAGDRTGGAANRGGRSKRVVTGGKSGDLVEDTDGLVALDYQRRVVGAEGGRLSGGQFHDKTVQLTETPGDVVARLLLGCHGLAEIRRVVEYNDVAVLCGGSARQRGHNEGDRGNHGSDQHPQHAAVRADRGGGNGAHQTVEVLTLQTPR